MLSARSETVGGSTPGHTNTRSPAHLSSEAAPKRLIVQVFQVLLPLIYTQSCDPDVRPRDLELCVYPFY